MEWVLLGSVVALMSVTAVCVGAWAYHCGYERGWGAARPLQPRRKPEDSDG